VSQAAAQQGPAKISDSIARQVRRRLRREAVSEGRRVQVQVQL
jgi:hypothetical protein